MSQLHPLEIELRDRIRRDCFSTAYPLSPSDWAQYRTDGQLTFKGGGNVSFYIHIPFCKNLCKFCEYTRTRIPEEDVQRNYLQIVHRDIRRFLLKYPNIILEGFDIGGGTPTSLSPVNFAYLMQIYKEVVHRVRLSDDFEPSIEASIVTLTPEKIRMIAEAGIRRISMGIQSSYFSRSCMPGGWRFPQAKEIIETIRKIRDFGMFKINLDFMYGFKEQRTWDTMDCDRNIIDALHPDHVTLYEFRTNQLKGQERENPLWRIKDYDIWFKMLTEMGYLATYGRNTFSIDRHDYGVSSYIRHRMLEGGDYKGFGISAQSMSDGNVEYSIGKNHPDILSLIPSGRIPQDTSFDATEHYELPLDEKLAKFICVSAYSGGFSWRTVKEKYSPDFFSRFGEVIDFLIDRASIAIDNDRIYLTQQDFKHYGAILSMFYKPATIQQ